MVKDFNNVTLDDVLKPGKNMVAAGYCMYGSSCTVQNLSFIVAWFHYCVEFFLIFFLNLQNC